MDPMGLVFERLSNSHELANTCYVIGSAGESTLRQPKKHTCFRTGTSGWSHNSRSSATNLNGESIKIPNPLDFFTGWVGETSPAIEKCYEHRLKKGLEQVMVSKNIIFPYVPHSFIATFQRQTIWWWRVDLHQTGRCSCLERIEKLLRIQSLAKLPVTLVSIFLVSNQWSWGFWQMLSLGIHLHGQYIFTHLYGKG